MKLTQLIAAATTAAVLGTAGVSVAGAVSSSSTNPAHTTTATAATAATKTASGTTARRHRALRRRIARRAEILAAKTIGIKPRELAREIKAGKTIAAVATAHNVAPQTVIDTLVAAGTKKIEAAKTADKITAARATALEQKLPARAAAFVNNAHPAS
jgi:hypothetical protein